MTKKNIRIRCFDHLIDRQIGTTRTTNINLEKYEHFKKRRRRRRSMAYTDTHKCHWYECVNKLLFELIMHCVINNLKIWICMPTGRMKRTHCSQSAYHPCVNQIAQKASRPAVLVTPTVRYWTRPQVLFTEFILRQISNQYVNCKKKTLTYFTSDWTSISIEAHFKITKRKSRRDI